MQRARLIRPLSQTWMDVVAPIRIVRSLFRLWIQLSKVAEDLLPSGYVR